MCIILIKITLNLGKREPRTHRAYQSIYKYYRSIIDLRPELHSHDLTSTQIKFQICMILKWSSHKYLDTPCTWAKI